MYECRNQINKELMIHNFKSIHYLIIFLFTLSSTSCSRDNSLPEALISAAEESTSNFSGLESIEDIADSTVTLNWSASADAVNYQIFNVSSGSLELIATIEDNMTAQFRVTNLTPNQLYKFRVRLLDGNANLDNNTNDIEIQTNAAPNTPSSVNLKTPSTSPGYDKTPTISVSGIKQGDTVKLYSDEACSSEVVSQEIIEDTSSIDFEITSALAIQTHNFYATSTNSIGNSSECTDASSSLTYEISNCPSGYVLVPKNIELEVNAFCVMQFEAKAQSMNDGVAGSVESTGGAAASWATIYHPETSTTGYRPVSEAENTPWRYVSPVDAKAACLNLGAGYDVISNPEWMTIALNVEAQSTNWSGGVLGSGFLNRGNSGHADACSFDGATPGSGASRNTLAKLTLSNSEEIWDFSGNNMEWVDWAHPSLSGTTGEDFLEAPTSCPGDGTFTEFPANNCSVLLDEDYLPGNPASPPVAMADYDSNYGLGSIYLATGGAAGRGGMWFHGVNTGVFALHLLYTKASDSSANISFRCVHRLGY